MENQVQKAEQRSVEMLRLDVAKKLIDPTGIVEIKKAKYSSLEITDINDKAQIKIVRAAQKDCRNERIEFNKRLGKVRENIVDFKKQVDNIGSEGFKGLDGLYLELKGKADAAENAVKEAKEAEEAKAAKIHAGKVDKLMKAGFMSNGIQLLVGKLIVEHNTIDEMSDDQIDKLCIEGAEESDRIKVAMKMAEDIAKKEAEEKAKSIAEMNQVAAEPAPNPIQSGVPIATNPPIQQSQVIRNMGDQPAREPIPDVPFGAAPTLPIDYPTVQKSASPVVEDGHISADFGMGFKACQHAVKDLMNNSAPMRRSEMIALIMNLKP